MTEKLVDKGCEDEKAMEQGQGLVADSRERGGRYDVGGNLDIGDNSYN